MENSPQLKVVSQPLKNPIKQNPLQTRTPLNRARCRVGRTLGYRQNPSTNCGHMHHILP